MILRFNRIKIFILLIFVYFSSFNGPQPPCGLETTTKRKKMVDGKPLAGTVSMLASRFTHLKSPSKAEKNPQVSGAIDKLIEATREYNDAKLVELVKLFAS